VIEAVGVAVPAHDEAALLPACLAAGGFSSLPTAEDHALLRALNAIGSAVMRATDITVETSGRRHGRAPAGFSHLLAALTSPA
jgi:hypothetical protein